MRGAAFYDCARGERHGGLRPAAPTRPTSLPMRFEIVVAPEPDLLHRSEARDPEPSSLGALEDGSDAPRPRASATARRRPPAREVLDVFLDGANVTARVA